MARASSRPRVRLSLLSLPPPSPTSATRRSGCPAPARAAEARGDGGGDRRRAGTDLSPPPPPQTLCRASTRPATTPSRAPTTSTCSSSARLPLRRTKALSSPHRRRVGSVVEGGGGEGGARGGPCLILYSQFIGSQRSCRRSREKRSRVPRSEESALLAAPCRREPLHLSLAASRLAEQPLHSRVAQTRPRNARPRLPVVHRPRRAASSSSPRPDFPTSHHLATAQRESRLLHGFLEPFSGLVREPEGQPGPLWAGGRAAGGTAAEERRL